MTTTADQSAPDRREPASATDRPTGLVRRLLRTGFVRYLVVGGGSAALDTGLLWLLHGAFEVWLPLATFVGVVTSTGLNFLLNRSWVFASTGGAGGQLVRYLILVGVNWVLTVLMVSALAGLGLNYLVAKCLALVVLTTLNFLLYRAWVFRDPSPAAAVD
ncbi:GtrA family protein [Micromonospora sp. NBC_01699]|uniref:GtrA family protein n=1 Tax=Micromonospora sp. NBC_01699 TaxID=2975984 RepID=UPI002E330DD9|nr:GtrA family protein [Micromonospora sp. NBC_01699]